MLGEPPPFQTGTLYPAYLRSQAYLLAHNGAAAAAEFQKLVDHRGIVLNQVKDSHSTSANRATPNFFMFNGLAWVGQLFIVKI